MKTGAAAWSGAFAVSLAVHSGILMGLGGMARAPRPPPAAELLIGDKADLSSLAVDRVATEPGPADLAVSSGPPLSPRASAPVAVGRVEGTSYASAEDPASQRLAPTGQASEYGAVETAEVAAAENSVHDLRPAPQALHAAAGVEPTSEYPSTALDGSIAAIDQSGTALPATQPLEMQAIRKEMRVDAAKGDTADTAPVPSHAITTGNVEALQFPGTMSEGAELQSVPAGGQPGQPSAQVVDKAYSEVHVAAADDRQLAAPASGIDEKLSQAPPEAISAASSERRVAAANIADVAGSVPGSSIKSTIAPISGSQELRSPPAAVEPARSEDNAPEITPVPGGHGLTATEVESGRMESNAGVALAQQPVQSGVAQLAAPVSEGSVAAPQPAKEETLAMVAPHPAIILPPAKVLPDDPVFRMTNFIRDYDGGFCFFAVPRSLDGPRPRIEGFGSRLELIHAFGEAFRLALGIEPDLGMRQITQWQCPALGFVGEILKSHAPEITVGLASDLIRNGDELKGTLDGISLSHVSLLLIDDDGMVHDVSRYLRRTVDGMQFAAPIQLTGEGQGRNQLIVSVAADRELEFMQTNKPAAGAGYFLSAIAEARAAGAEISVGLGAFRVE